MKSTLGILILTLTMACLSPVAQGVPTSIDGDLSDWGVTPDTDWEPSSNTADYHLDQSATGNEYKVNNFTANYNLKAIYFDNDADYFYFAVAGNPLFGPGNASNGFTGNEFDDPGGDLILDMDGNMSVSTHGIASNVDHGVRVTSGLKTHVGDILQLAPYAPRSDGSRQGSTWVDTALYPHNNSGLWWDDDGDGSIETTEDELDGGGNGIVDAGEMVEGWQGSPWLVFAGNDAGEAIVAYNGGVLEVAIARSLFPGIGNGDQIGVHMTMWCGNDSINLLATVNDVVIPVPSALVLAGLGSGLAGWLRIRRRVG